jgi:hypothetical protein
VRVPSPGGVDERQIRRGLGGAGGAPRPLSRPPISLWEQRAAVARLWELGRYQVDENMLFSMVEQMRRITEDAAAKTRKARRALERRCATPPPRKAAVVPPPPSTAGGAAGAAVAKPFEVIEQWEPGPGARLWSICTSRSGGWRCCRQPSGFGMCERTDGSATSAQRRR